MSMTDSPGTTTGQGATGGSMSGTAGVAKEQAAEVGSSATQAAGQVAQTSKEQATEVAQEAKRQVRDLAGEVRTQVTDQASSQQSKLAGTLHSLGDELQQIASGNGGQSGIATDLADQFSSKIKDIAGMLENREPGELIDEVRSFARQRPGAFLLGAAVAGVLAGRMTRGTVAARSSDDTSGSAGYAGSLPVPSTTATSTNTDPYAATGAYGSDPTIDLTGAAYPASTHGTSAEGYREPTTGPLSTDGGYTEGESRPQGWQTP
jgi:hypothetical protein